MIRPKVAPPRQQNQHVVKQVKSGKPTQPNYGKPLDKGKGKVVNLDVPKVVDVNQSKPSSIYLKKSFSKNSVWKVKSSETSVLPAPEKTTSDGKWIDVWIRDSLGQPKTVKAWVPKMN